MNSEEQVVSHGMDRVSVTGCGKVARGCHREHKVSD